MSDTSARPAALTPAQRAAVARRVEDAYAVARSLSARGVAPYLNQLIIDRAGSPAPYRDVAEGWQKALAGRMVPALEAVAGVRQTPYNGPRSFWFTLPRGHDKTSLIARLCMWLLAFSRYPVRAVAAAADKEQAGLISEFMASEARLNPWLEPMLRFGNWRVDGVRQGSRLKIMAAEDRSSFGLREDFHVLDEVTHWPRRGLWDTIVSGREKRPGSVLIVITNAGCFRTWQRDVFEIAKASPDWYVYESPGQLAGWMSAARVAELRKLLPAALAARLYDNRWTDPDGSAGFVTLEEARACEDPDLAMADRGRPGVSYVASIDYAPVRDRTVMCVGHEEAEAGRVVLDRMDVLQGSRERRVPIQAVEAWIDRVVRDFNRPALVVDPYQMESVIQRYQGTVEVEPFEARGGKANYELASCLRGLIVNGRLALYPNAGEVTLPDGSYETLVDELASLLVVQRSFGYRIDHAEGAHDDRSVALGQLCVHLARGRGRVAVPTSDRWF